MKDSTTSQEDEESEDEGLEEVQNTIIMTSLNQQFCVSVVFSKTSKYHVGPTWAAALLLELYCLRIRQITQQSSQLKL